MQIDLSFFQNKKVLVTGHTGFKGTWLCRILLLAGADVTGFALSAPTKPSLYDLCQMEKSIKSIKGDVRDLEAMQKVFTECRPEIVFHLAAQPIVRESYRDPVGTYATNVMGTVNLLECVRQSTSVHSVVNITTDKVYLNREWEWGYRENEVLNGYDPYSNSKSCSELVTSSYKKSFFEDREVAISTCRAGNVIGGGDFAADRIVPDCVRAALKGADIVVRNPFSTRPYQHVLEPLMAYLMIAKEQYAIKTLAGSYNIGPDDSDCWTTGQLVGCFCKEWEKQTGKYMNWINQYDGGPHEAKFLKLDCSKIKTYFGWKPVWNVATAIEKIVEWTMVYENDNDLSICMDRQIKEYINDSME